MATHSSILASRFHGQRSLVGSSPWGRKESDMTERPSLTHRLTLSTEFHKCPWSSLFLNNKLLPRAKKKKKSQIAVSINKALLEHNHVHLFIHCLWLLSG